MAMPMFEHGDQDYGSAYGWEPENQLHKLIEAEKKRNPLAFAPEPQMLWTSTASKWCQAGSGLPPGEQLFGPFWLRRELAILFAATGLGKSVLATLIAESLARGIPIQPFGGSPVGPQRVLYLDFELTREQFAVRYACVDGAVLQNPYDFSPDLHRSQLEWDGQIIEGYNGFTDMLFRSLTNEIERYRAEVVIVDNITFLDRRPTSNESTARSIMLALNSIKKHYEISILVLAHTPKRRMSNRLTEFDMQGSINLANFADSIFAIGPSRRGTNLRYVKQIKVRSRALEHGESNVAVFSLQKFDAAVSMGLVANPGRTPINNFLGFRFETFAHEEDHAGPGQPQKKAVSQPINWKKSTITNIQRLAGEGKSVRAIAAKLKVPKTTVARYMQTP